MNCSIRIPKLMQQLVNVEDMTEKLKNPLYPVETQPESIQYLYEKFFLPIIKDNSVSVSGLDMGRFERDDLETLWELYQNQIGPDSPNWRNLQRIYSVCKETSPECHTISFI